MLMYMPRMERRLLSKSKRVMRFDGRDMSMYVYDLTARMDINDLDLV